MREGSREPVSGMVPGSTRFPDSRDSLRHLPVGGRNERVQLFRWNRGGLLGRCLIAEDDVSTRDYLVRVLSRYGFACVLASDGQDAAYWMGLETFDAAFVSLELSALPGGHLAEMVHRGVLRRPNAMVLIGSAPALARVADHDWAGGAELLAKPVTSKDVKHVLEKHLGSIETVAVPMRRGVALAGRGFWADSIASLVSRRGAPVSVAGSIEEISALAETRPAAVIVGPPFDDAAIVAICSDVRRDIAFTGATVVAVVRGADHALRADLLTLGVDRSVPLSAGLERLHGEVLRVAGLAARKTPRVELSTGVRIEDGSARIQLARAFDVAEGGLGLRIVTEAPEGDELGVEFVLPGTEDVISAVTEVAWVSASGERTQLGVKFVALADADRDRIRDYVHAQQEAP